MSSRANAPEDKSLEKDLAWTGPKFIGLGFVTLLIALSIIVYAAAQTGCGVKIVP